MDYSIISRHRDKLMGVAALWIYAFHIFPAPAFSEARGLGLLWWYVRNAGFCGVDMFLFLSGLGLAYSMEKHPVTDAGECLRFWGRRFWRIYVTFLPFTVVFALLDGWSIGVFLKRLICLDQFAGNLYNFCWYVCCILLMYLLAPGLYRLVRGSGAVLTALGVTYVAGLFLARDVLRNDLYAIAVRLPVFVLGLRTGKRALDRQPIGRTDWIMGWGMLTVGVVLSFGLNSHLLPSPIPASNALVNVLLAPGLILVLCGIFSRIEKYSWTDPVWKILVFFGGISFEFYLLQEWYVRLGVQVLSASGKKQHLILLCVMTGLSVLLQLVSKLIKKVKI